MEKGRTNIFVLCGILHPKGTVQHPQSLLQAAKKIVRQLLPPSAQLHALQFNYGLLLTKVWFVIKQE